MFTMETNGTLRTAMEFDYESYQTLSIRVKAVDPSNESVEGSFTVQVSDVVETTPNQAPVGLDHLSSLSIAENEVPGNHSWNFSGTGSGRRCVDLSFDEWIGRWEQLDVYYGCEWYAPHGNGFDYESYETLSIRVKAMDGNNSSVEGTFTVLIVDVSDNPVNLPRENLTFVGNLGILENQPIGTIIGEFNASDPDGDSLVYLLTRWSRGCKQPIIYFGCKRDFANGGDFRL